MKKRFDEIPIYKQFVNQRDEALEQIYRNHRLKITDIIDKAFTDAMSVLQAKYQSIVVDPYNKRKIRAVDEQLDQVFDSATQTVAWQQVMLRRAVYMLAHAGEAEAIARTMKNPAKIKLNYDDISKKAYDKLPDGTELIKRIDLYFSEIRKKLVTALEQALIFGDDANEMLGRAFMALPKKKQLPEKTVLKKVKRAKIAEAKKPSFTGNDEVASGVTFDFGPKGGVRISSIDWDNATWEQVHKLWHEDYALTDRGPENFFDLKNPFSREPLRPDVPEGDKIYGWELEQQLTHDFVKSVRDGQLDAANFNGINEFIWIAIIDQRTCEMCCEWRSGLTTSEIEKTLADNPELKDHCDVVVPPAHFNCRCGIAPVAIDLQSTDIQTTDAKEFDDWLNGN